VLLVLATSPAKTAYLAWQGLKPTWLVMMYDTHRLASTMAVTDSRLSEFFFTMGS
jgi:hypothetical protein